MTGEVVAYPTTCLDTSPLCILATRHDAKGHVVQGPQLVARSNLSAFDLRNRKYGKQMSKQAVLTKAFHEVLVHDVNGDGVSFVLAVLLLLLAQNTFFYRGARRPKH